MRQRRLLASFLLLACHGTARAERWEDATLATIGTTAEWSNKVELADVDGDGRIDILFANGGDYASPGTPEATRIFRNLGERQFEEATDELLGAGGENLARVVKVRDVDGDGAPDLFIGNTYSTRSRLYLGDGRGGLTDVTETHLPAGGASVGDLELGDVDGDGDLDAVLADWGPGNPLSNAGGRTRLWLNDGEGRFTDATAERMPDRLIQFSWELELCDVDNDFDLDAVVSCKTCDGSALYRNDGSGVFSDDSESMPQFRNNYEFEAMDLDADGWLDLVTINDGAGLREHVFRGDGTGFVDATAELWPLPENQPADDNMVAFLDADSDGDADFLIGSLSGDDRLLVNDGTGHLTVDTAIRTGPGTTGTLGIALADLDGDGRLDLVEAQGEAEFADKVYFGTAELPVDTTAPAVALVEAIEEVATGEPLVVRARVHDFKTPVMTHDFAEVSLRVAADGGEEEVVALEWYGEALWRGSWPAPARIGAQLTYRVCAGDRNGNSACSAEKTAVVGEGGDPDAGTDDPDAGVGADASPDRPDAGGGAADGDGGGCGCRAGRNPGAGMLWILSLIPLVRRRKRAA